MIGYLLTDLFFLYNYYTNDLPAKYKFEINITKLFLVHFLC